MFATFQNVVKHIGLPINMNKVFVPTRRLAIMGIVVVIETELLVLKQEVV